jgi:hypothetical protein
MFTPIAVISQPTLGLNADQFGLPDAYLGLVGSPSVLIVFLFWRGRHHFPEPATSI